MVTAVRTEDAAPLHHRRRRPGAADRLRPGRARAPWGSRSWARWSSPSSAAGSRSGRPRPGAAPGPRSTYPSAKAVCRPGSTQWERGSEATRSLRAERAPAIAVATDGEARERSEHPSWAGSKLAGYSVAARALRRFSARRSSSLRPPQTPWSCPASRAHCRHCSRTSQRRHTCLASSIWRMAGPVLPIGKNSSGSSSRHAERWRQSMAGVSFFLDTFGWPESSCRWGVGVPAGGHTAGTAGRQAPPCPSSVPRIGPLHKGDLGSRGSQAPLATESVANPGASAARRLPG